MREPNKRRTYINYLRKFRRARGLKSKEVSAILGLRSSSTLSRWENGLCLPDSVNLLRLSALYRTFVDALFPEIASDLKSELSRRERDTVAPSRLPDLPRRVDIESMGLNSNIEPTSSSRRSA